MKPIPPSTQYFIAVVALFSASLGVLTGLSTHPETKKQSTFPLAATNSPFSSVNIEARTAFVYEPDTGRALYAKNERSSLPIASLTKIMTALVASEFLPNSTVIPLSRRHYRLKDLVSLTLLSSSNQGALALAAATEKSLGRDFVATMNNEARSLGLNQTTFINSTGLDSSDGQASSRSSAYDVAHLFAHVLSVRPELLAVTKFEEAIFPTTEGIRYRFQNTNEILRELPGLLASKTGFTDVAEGSLVVAFDRGLNQPIIIVVLGSTETGRFNDMKRLVQATIKTFLPTP